MDYPGKVIFTRSWNSIIRILDKFVFLKIIMMLLLFELGLLIGVLIVLLGGLGYYFLQVHSVDKAASALSQGIGINVSEQF